eukprot:jgi/Chrzof1/853/Cz01g31130.t1
MARRHVAAAVVLRKYKAGLISSLPQKGFWAISWSDTQLRNADSGLVRCSISVCAQDTERIMAMHSSLGPPSVKAILLAIYWAILDPMPGTPPLQASAGVCSTSDDHALRPNCC